MSKLAKPHFIKVKNLANGRSGFNIYVKVVKTEEFKSNDNLSTFVRAVVADQTASANAFFKGETAKLIKQGAVIAIRNGRIKFIKNKICLEIDIFGRVTPENIQIKANQSQNISDKEIQRREKRHDRPRHDDRPRRRRQDDEDRPRRPRENDRPRRNREYDEDRPSRRPRQQEDRPRRRPRQDDPDRRPRRDFDERRGERRPPIQWTKISQIEPGDENLNIIAKIVSAQNVGKKARLVIGDQTGIVKAFVFNEEWMEEGNTVVFFKAVAAVQKQHIEILLPKGSKSERARREVSDVNKKYDVSAKEWVEAS